MARKTASEVLSIIMDDDEWNNSDEEELSDSEDEVTQSNVNYLDRAQEDADPSDTDPSDASVSTSVSLSTSAITTPHPSPSSSPNSAHLPSNTQSNSTGAVPFNPLPFTATTGPSTILDSLATPLDFFLLLFDDQVFQQIVDQTNLYASQHPPGDRYPWTDTCVDEMKLFLGIIIAMGFHQLPQLEDYWSSDCLLKVPGIVDGMPINRFKLMLGCLHLNDNTLMKSRDDPEYDKLHKLRPLLTMARDNFMREFKPSRSMSVDEAMVGFKGRSSLKQYMPKKPTKRGYKVWCLCDATNGYMCNFEVYTGAGSGDIRECGGLGPYVVLQLTEPYRGLGHFVFYDNYFSTVDLASRLLEHDTYSCGTARSDRRKFPGGLKKLKLQRGSSKSELVESDTVNCISWQDKKLVHFIDTMCDPNETTQVTRKNKDGSRVLVDCPLAVKCYNAGMGGVDLSDAKRKVYSCSRKAKKWWHRLFYFILDVSIVNAHIIQSQTPHQPKLSQKNFRLELATELLSSYYSRKHRKRGRSSIDASPSVQFNDHHYPSKLNKPRQCQFCIVRKRTSYCCKECNSGDPLPLCVVPCFRLHHTKSKVS